MGPMTWWSINIIRATGTRLDPASCALGERIATVLGQISGAVASFRYSRRSTFSVTTAIFCISWLSLATTIQISPNEVDLFGNNTTTDDNNLGQGLNIGSYSILDYLPPMLIIFGRFTFQMGLAPYPWIYGNELFPLDLRSHLCAVTSSLEPVLVSLNHNSIYVRPPLIK